MSMARRNNNKLVRQKKLQPAEMTMSFSILQGLAGATQTGFIDLSQVASIINRRFYRQGLNWGVAGMKFISLEPGLITVCKLPNTWVLSNAWHKSYAIWRQMIENAVDEPGMESIKGRFLDFKIYADDDHHALGFGANLLPYDCGLAQSATAGQWQPSILAIPASDSSSITDYEMIAVGANMPGAGASGLNAKSLIQGYADSRGLPPQEDPNVPVDASLNWMAAVFNDGTLQSNAVIGDLEVTGDNPPYPFEGDVAGHVDTMYPGGETQMPHLQIHDITQIFATSGTTNVGTARGKGGNFPCGLVKIDWTASDAPANLVVQVDLIPGHHRGYLAEAMQEM